MTSPDYRRALLFTQLVAERQRGSSFEALATRLSERLARQLAADSAMEPPDATLALFDAMFSGLHVRESRVECYRLAERRSCEWCGSLMKVRESENGAQFGRRRWCTCRTCGVRAETPADWEPLLERMTGGRPRVRLPAGSRKAHVASAAVIVTGERVACQHVRLATVGEESELWLPVRLFERYLGCPVFLRVAVASAGRQATLFGRGRVTDTGDFM